MYITQLFIDNFKSFGKATRIPFLPGFTVISGPNGSGKSNIIDSILFVLSLSTSRTLRAERLTDLINVNSDKATAEVEITFSDGTIIRRRIKRAQNTYYNYLYLNGRACRQGDLLDFLAQNGIIPHGYNIVMQGDINRIIDMSDNERRKIIDEIAGVSDFDAKKEMAYGELSQVKERLSEESVHIEELSRRLFQLEKQREQAVRYHTLHDELKNLERCRSASRLAARKRDQEILLSGLGEEKKLVEAIELEVSDKSDKRNLIQQEIELIDQKISSMTGSEYLTLVSRIAEAKASIDGHRRSVDRARRDKEEAERSFSEIFSATKRQEEKLSSMEKDMRSLMIDRTNLSMTSSSVKKELDRINQTIEGETRGLEEDENSLEILQHDLQQLKDERGDLLKQQDILIERSRMRNAEEDRLSSRIQIINKDIITKKEDLTGLKSALERLSTEKRGYDQQVASLDTRLYTKRDEQERILRQIRDLKIDIGRKEAQQQVTGRYNRAIEAVIGMDGVFGTIGDLGSCQSEFAVALNIAAGGKLHFVVVKNDIIASDAIAYLQEHKLGRVTFLPLNKIHQKPRPSLPHGNDIIGYAIELLNYNPEYDAAFSVVFGSTIVVDTLEHARRRLGSFRMVTLDGSLLEVSGAMTGGSIKKETGGFGSQSVDEIKMLSSNLSLLSEEERNISILISELSVERDDLQKRRIEIEGAIVRAKAQTDTTEQAIISLQSEVDLISKQCEESRNNQSGKDNELVGIEKELEDKNRGITVVMSKIEEISVRLEGTGIPRLYEEREGLLRQTEEVDRRLRNKEQEVSEISMEISFIRRNIDDQKKQMERIREQTGRFDKEISDCEAAIISCEGEIKNAEAAVSQFSREIEDLRIERNTCTNQTDKLDGEIREYINRKERILIKIQSIDEKLISLSEEICNLTAETGDCITELSEPEVECKMSEVSLALSMLGNVNMRAIEEYDEVNGVVSERRERMDVLQREMDEINARIDMYSKKKFEAFNLAYQEINTNFSDIFSRLTMGSGELLLENKEDPFAGGLSFSVKPRDKNVHNLSALSGGEKSLTTLAFIFSIQKFVPAPFYAFDEVDMNLDGSNVIQIAEMIREVSINSQFINISLRKPMIDSADRILGVTIRPDKSSLVTGVSRDD